MRCGQGPYVEAWRAEWALKAQLLAPPPPQAEWVPPYWSPCMPLPLANPAPGVRVSERGQLKVQQEGLGWSTKFLDEVSGEPRAHTAHTAPTRWEGQRPPQPQSGAGSLQYSHAHTDLMCSAPPAWGGAQGPNRIGAGSHIGEGVPWESVLSVSPQLGIPGSIWGAGDPNPPARLAEVRTAAEEVWTDGWRAGQSHLCSAS